MSELYTSGRYAEANPDWHATGAPHKAAVLAQLALAHELAPRTVVDVGCGAGLVLRGFADLVEAHGWREVRYEGWDIAPEAIARAAAHASERVHYVVGDWLTAGRRADLVLCVDVFEHISDDRAFLRQLAGTAVHALFRIPLDASWLNRLRPERLKALERQYGHLHHYHRASALQRLAEAGFVPMGGVYHRVPPRIERLRGRLSDAVRQRLFRVAPHATVRALGGYSLVVLAHTAKV